MKIEPIKATLYKKANKSGTKSFGVRHGIKPNGKYAVKIFPPGNEEQARRFVEEWNNKLNADRGSPAMLEEVHQHEIRLALQRLKNTGASLLQAVDFFIKHGKPTYPDTLLTEGIQLFLKTLQDRHRKPEYIATIRATTLVPFTTFVGNRTILQVSKEDVRRFINHKPNWSATTRHVHRRYLSVLFNFFKEEGYVVQNPVEGIVLPTLIKKDVAHWTPEEVWVQLQYCVDNLQHRTLASLVLSSFCGARLRETSRLSWSQFTPSNGVALLANQAKRNKRRLLLPSPNSEAWLRSIPSEDRKGDAKMSSQRAIGQNLQRIKQNLGKKNFFDRRLQNGCRQAFAAYHYAKFRNDAQLAEVMGNSPATIREHYAEIVSQSEADIYFHLLPKDTLTTGLDDCLKMRLWTKTIPANPDWLIVSSGQTLKVWSKKLSQKFELLKHKYKDRLDRLERLQRATIVKLPIATKQLLFSQLSFMDKYGFDPANEATVHGVMAAKQYLESKLGQTLQTITF